MAYSNTCTQLAALSAVHNFEFKDARVEALQAKLAETTLEMERARMSAEDSRSAMHAAHSTVHATRVQLYKYWRPSPPFEEVSVLDEGAADATLMSVYFKMTEAQSRLEQRHVSDPA